MIQAAASLSEKWRLGLQRVRTFSRKAFPFISGAFAAVTVIVIYNLLTPTPPQLTEREIQETVAQALASATPPPPLSSLVYRVIQPSLVLIQTNVSDGNQTTENDSQDVALAANNRSVPVQQIQNDELNVGTGVVINDAGDILTSLHVVAGAANIQVTFADGTQSNAQIVGAQIENDIAVLRAERPPALVIPATLGNPNAMRIGDEAFIVGHPFGLYGSMSTGVISGFERTFRSSESGQELQGLIQVDAAANPGNSGGPLLNRAGHVVGIVTAILNPTGQEVFIGISFAVPITSAAGGAGLPPY